VISSSVALGAAASGGMAIELKNLIVFCGQT
jgi:hypothetical protein